MLALSLLKKTLLKVAGSHLLTNHVLSPQTGAGNTLEGMIAGYGWRFALGFMAALWATNPVIPLECVDPIHFREVAGAFLHLIKL